MTEPGSGPRRRFAEILSGGLRHANTLPVEEHARLAHCAGGPSIPELERVIRAYRAGDGTYTNQKDNREDTSNG